MTSNDGPIEDDNDDEGRMTTIERTNKRIKPFRIAIAMNKLDEHSFQFIKRMLMADEDDKDKEEEEDRKKERTE